MIQKEEFMTKLGMLSTFAGATLLYAAPISLHWSPTKQLSVSLDTAQARIGRRRAYYGGYGGYYGYHHPYHAYGYHPLTET
jgi:hypothetical protein